MPQQIHWTVGSADLRFHVRCPKIYRSQQTEHSHIVGCCQSEGLWGCHALKTSLSAVRGPYWHCSDQVEGVGQISALSRSHPLPGLLEGFFAVWCYTGVMDGDIQWKVWAWPGTE